MAAFQLEHHAFDVLIVLVRLEKLQALLRIAPLQDLDWLLTGAPRIHFALIRHVKINRVTAGKRPAVIIDSIHLPGGKQPESCARWPARPISRSAPDHRHGRRRSGPSCPGPDSCRRSSLRHREWLQPWRIGDAPHFWLSGFIHRDRPWNFIDWDRARNCFGSMNRRTGGVQFSTERVVIAVFAMIRFRVRVGGCTNVLKTGFCQGPFILRQRTRARPAGTEEECPGHGKRKQ